MTKNMRDGRIDEETAALLLHCMDWNSAIPSCSFFCTFEQSDQLDAQPACPPVEFSYQKLSQAEDVFGESDSDFSTDNGPL